MNIVPSQKLRRKRYSGQEKAVECAWTCLSTAHGGSCPLGVSSAVEIRSTYDTRRRGPDGALGGVSQTTRLRHKWIGPA